MANRTMDLVESLRKSVEGIVTTAELEASKITKTDLVPALREVVDQAKVLKAWLSEAFEEGRRVGREEGARIPAPDMKAYAEKLVNVASDRITRIANELRESIK